MVRSKPFNGPNHTKSDQLHSRHVDVHARLTITGGQGQVEDVISRINNINGSSRHH
jgi:hypothetical protein